QGGERAVGWRRVVAAAVPGAGVDEALVHQGTQDQVDAAARGRGPVGDGRRGKRRLAEQAEVHLRLGLRQAQVLEQGLRVRPHDTSVNKFSSCWTTSAQKVPTLCPVFCRSGAIKSPAVRPEPGGESTR